MTDILPTGRLRSLDAFRGMTIAGMLLVNHPGTWAHIYHSLRHAQWHGLTPTDLIFPFFLYIAGISMTFSFAKRMQTPADKNRLLLHTLRRAAIIYLLGFLLTFAFRWDLSTVRIPGVLQRIAVCYLFAGIIFLYLGRRGRIAAGVALLLVYWAVMKLLPVPGFGAGDLSYEGNACGYIDSLLLSGHIYRESFDPEGILSTLPAVVTVLTGIFTGDWLRSGRPRIEISHGLFLSGTVMLLGGYVWSIWLPVNKQLWTNSYVFVSAGFGSLLLGLCYWLIDIKGRTRWAFPFVVFGTNAIAAYFCAHLTSKALAVHRIGETSIYGYLYRTIFSGAGAAECSSLLFALFYVFLWFLLILILYKKRIFIKV